MSLTLPTILTPTPEQVAGLLDRMDDGDYYRELDYMDDSFQSSAVDLVYAASQAGLFGAGPDVAYWPAESEDTVGGLVTVDLGSRGRAPRLSSLYVEARHLCDVEATGEALIASLLAGVAREADEAVEVMRRLQ